ncbi:MAG: diguanylate cyclase [Motiliproteus sp.]
MDQSVDQSIAVSDVHWMMDALQSIEVGLLVVDSDSRIVAWNGFMEHHSGISAASAIGANLFQLVTDLPVAWMSRQLEAVTALKVPAYSTWKQRPYLFRFKSYRPITGSSDFMYQDVSFLPLSSVNAGSANVCITLYDVTQNAVNEQAMTRLNAELAHLSKTDRMTQLHNRGHWEELALHEFKRCQRSELSSCLVMFDIDHFKNVNDTYGHQVGDEVIIALAATVRKMIRDTDMAGRYGGEEFAVVLCDTDAQGAAMFCERARYEIEQMVVETLGETVRFTISLGFSQINTQIGSLEVWLKQADAALYHSKEHGRNQSTQYDAVLIPL